MKSQTKKILSYLTDVLLNVVLCLTVFYVWEVLYINHTVPKIIEKYNQDELLCTWIEAADEAEGLTSAEGYVTTDSIQ